MNQRFIIIRRALKTLTCHSSRSPRDRRRLRSRLAHVTKALFHEPCAYVRLCATWECCARRIQASCEFREVRRPCTPRFTKSVSCQSSYNKLTVGRWKLIRGGACVKMTVCNELMKASTAVVWLSDVQTVNRCVTATWSNLPFYDACIRRLRTTDCQPCGGISTRESVVPDVTDPLHGNMHDEVDERRSREYRFDDTKAVCRSVKRRV